MLNDLSSASCAPGSMILDAGCELSGTLRVAGDLRLLGRFDGRLEVEGLLVVGPGAELRGHAVARRLRVEGVVEASVHAAETVWLCGGGELRGGVHTPSLQTDAGPSSAAAPQPAAGQETADPGPAEQPAAAEDEARNEPVEEHAGVLHRRRRPAGRTMAAAAGR